MSRIEHCIEISEGENFQSIPPGMFTTCQLKVQFSVHHHKWREIDDMKINDDYGLDDEIRCVHMQLESERL